MIKIFSTITPSDDQWLTAIQGMRNPMNSWDKSDSKGLLECLELGCSSDCINRYCPNVYIGENDYDLMKRLVLAGTEHGKFLRMLPVMTNIEAPLYWWKEFDTYKIGTTANSCSTMHKIAAKEFTLEDFSTEHLYDTSILTLKNTIVDLNIYREKYLKNKDKNDWWQLIQLLPNSYNQRRTVSLNYAVLANIYNQRKNHKLDEWNVFCDWIESLPYHEFITKIFVQNEN